MKYKINIFQPHQLFFYFKHFKTAWKFETLDEASDSIVSHLDYNCSHFGLNYSKHISSTKVLMESEAGRPLILAQRCEIFGGEFLKKMNLVK